MLIVGFLVPFGPSQATVPLRFFRVQIIDPANVNGREGPLIKYQQCYEMQLIRLYVFILCIHDSAMLQSMNEGYHNALEMSSELCSNFIFLQ